MKADRDSGVGGRPLCPHPGARVGLPGIRTKGRGWESAGGQIQAEMGPEQLFLGLELPASTVGPREAGLGERGPPA